MSCEDQSRGRCWLEADPDFGEPCTGVCELRLCSSCGETLDTQKVEDRWICGPCQVSEMARALGRLGGLKGGKARAAALSPERRREIAVKAAYTRWFVHAEPSETRRK